MSFHVTNLSRTLRTIVGVIAGESTARVGDNSLTYGGGGGGGVIMRILRSKMGLLSSIIK